MDVEHEYDVCLSFAGEQRPYVEQVAEILHCRPTEVAFVGCGSESDNLAIKGTAFAAQKKGNHLITTPIEHHAVLHTCQYLERFGFKTTYLPVDSYGCVNPDDVADR